MPSRLEDKFENESSGLVGPDGNPLPTTQPQEEAPADVELDFFNYIASLSFQAMVFLGEVPNPITNQTEKNIKQAKFLIDTLVLIREKTMGNLTKEEGELLHGSIFELQRKYINITK